MMGSVRHCVGLTRGHCATGSK